MHHRPPESLRQITTEPLAETAEALRRAAPVALEAVISRLRLEAPDLRTAPRPYLEDALPNVLDQLAAVMAEGVYAVGRLTRDSAKHSEHRECQEWDLDRILLEYQVLRDVLPARMVEELGRELTGEESTRLHAALDLSLREAARQFAEQERRKLQSEAAAMTKYLSFLSHDLRGNLNGAMLMIEVLRRDLQHEERFAESVQDLDAMRQSMLELVGTMDRFLQAERLRQGRVEVSLQVVDVGEFLHEQRRAIDRQMRGAGARIDVSAEPELRVNTDREMLGLIVQNTLSNCVKYAGGGLVKMRASALEAPADPSAPACRIEVSDDGPGMDREIQRRLFEPFVRGAETGRPGTGLGLFIAKQAADLLGATLRVESELGCGTRFVIDLPNFRFAESSVDSRVN